MFVAEVGLNHLGDPDYALEYVDTLVTTPVDAVSFQIREPAFYSQDQIDFDDLKTAIYTEIKRRLDVAGKQFGIALADPQQIDMCQDLGVDFYKLLSWDIRNHEFISELFERTACHLHVSTGTSDMKELESFVETYRGYLDRISFIHTQLSHSIDTVNLRALEVIHKRFGMPVGFGNHCEDPVAILGAASLGASDLFVYVYGDRPVRHPDQEHAIPLTEVADYIARVEQLVRALGTGEKIGAGAKENPIEKAYINERLKEDR